MERAENNLSRIAYFGIAGLCSLFVAVGLCRFSYTPLVPAMIQQGWLTKVSASYLGTIHFLGYLLGALSAHRITKYIPAHRLLRWSFLLSVAGLGMCSVNWGFAWLSVGRLTVGATGAILTIITPSVVWRHVPSIYKTRVMGIVISGVSFGVITSGLLLPFLVQISLLVAWLGSAFIALLATIIAWSAFSDREATVEVGIPLSSPTKINHRAVTLVCIAYGIGCIGFIAFSIFLSDYVHQQLHLSILASGLFLGIFGLGGLVGSYASGWIADKTSPHHVLVASFGVTFITIGTLLIHPYFYLYILTTFLMGSCIQSVVTLTSTRMLELGGAENHTLLWGRATLSFSIAQFVSAYVMSLLLAHGADYRDCFVLADVTALMAMVMVFYAK